jgi:hypothetical protein
MALWGQGLALQELDKEHQVGDMMVQEEERGVGRAGRWSGWRHGGMHSCWYWSKIEAAALLGGGGSPGGTAGGALRLLHGLEPGHPGGEWPTFVLVTVGGLAEDSSGSASANENSSDIPAGSEFLGMAQWRQ